MKKRILFFSNQKNEMGFSALFTHLFGVVYLT
jgi:hypothetical protein